MRKNGILLIFVLVTSIITWENFQLSINEKDRIEQSLEEGKFLESSDGEEETEDEHLHVLQLYFAEFHTNHLIFESNAGFCYRFSLNLFSKEPEVFPPRC